MFGVHHPPLGRARRKAVLLCYPSVQEYMRTHWAFRKLAGFLAREGFHVLRFDYYGTGDSAGDYQESNIGEWLADIREAADELKDRADVRDISIVGLQLGATLAALATADGLTVRELVLWEPVVDGSTHLDQLREMEKLKFGMLRHGPRPRPHELHGYVLPDHWSADLARLRLTKATTCRAERIVIFGSDGLAEYHELARHLHDRTGGPATVQVVPEEVASGPDSALLATRVLQAMAAELSRSAA